MDFWKKFGKRQDCKSRKIQTEDWRYRRLSFEGFETRRLLSAEPFCGPLPAPQEYLCVTSADFELTASSYSNTVGTSSISVEPTAPTTLALYSYYEYEETLAQASFQDESEGVGAVRIVERSEFKTTEPDFYHNGVPYYSHLAALSFGGSSAETVVFSDSAEGSFGESSDAASGESESTGRNGVLRGSGGGEQEVWNISLTVENSQTDSNLSSTSAPNALIEGKGATIGAADPLEGANYFTITAPALHIDYYATIEFSGSATFGTDYVVYSTFSNVMTLLAGGAFTYSGGATSLILVPLNDAIFESPESVTATLNPPQLMGSGGASSNVSFNYGTTTVTATIIDDDQWKAEVVVTNSDDNILVDAMAYSLLPLELRSADVCRFGRRIYCHNSGTPSY